MNRTGANLSQVAGQANRQGAQGTFHRNQIVSALTPVPGPRPRGLMYGGGGGIGGVNEQTSNYTATGSDAGKLIVFIGSSALTLTLPSNPPSSSWMIFVQNLSSKPLTITPGSLTLDSYGNQTLGRVQGIAILTDGHNYFTVRSYAPMMFAINGLSNADYFTANPYDGTTVGSDNYYIAKPNRLRPSVGAESIDGETITYSSYSGDNTRTASDGTNTEYQVVFPRYVVYSGSPTGVDDMSVIWAVPILNGTGCSSAPLWLEIAPARVWARRYNQ